MPKSFFPQKVERFGQKYKRILYAEMGIISRFAALHFAALQAFSQISPSLLDLEL